MVDVFIAHLTSALSFLLLEGPFDQAAAWAALHDQQRDTIKNEYSTAGIRLIVYAFGDSEQPTTRKADPVSTANSMAQFVLNHGLEGIDVDYEVCVSQCTLEN